MKVIEVKELCKDYKVAIKENNIFKSLISRKYRVIEAVKNINFSVEEGDLVGFIGPNGAGKSTVIKMLTGILVPTSGSISVLGVVPYKERERNAMKIGVLFGQRSQLWWDLPVNDTYILLKKIYKVNDQIYKQNFEKYIPLLGINDFLDQPVRQLSLGQRMRAELCATLLHGPELLFLDEPTIGLDVIAKQQIRELIKAINNSGVTVIITTHDMKDIEQMCKRLVMINKGEVVIDSNVEEIKNLYHGLSTMELTVEKGYNTFKIDGVENVKYEENKITIVYDSSIVSAAEIINQVIANNKLIGIEIKEPEIDDIIRDLYKATSDRII